MNNFSPNLPVTRREFLRMGGSGLGLLAFSAFAPEFLTRAAAANVPAPQKDRKILVLVQLAGGNDGLNTIVPYQDDLYYKLRPQLSFKDPKALLKLTDQVAFAPNCGPLAEMVKQGKFAVIQNVGYPNPNRSHFRSSEIWETASDTGTYLSEGWVGRYLDNCCGGKPLPSGSDPEAVHGGISVPQTFLGDTPHGYFGLSAGGGRPGAAGARAGRAARGRGAPTSDVSLLEQFAQSPTRNEEENFLSHTLMDALVTEKRVQQYMAGYQTTVQYPTNALAQSLRQVAALVAAGLETRVYFCTQTGYDTHANQFNTHQRLLGELSDSLAAFQKDLEAHGLDKQVLTMTFSEFGRRPYENGAGGTDHGTAAPLFLMGGALKAKTGVLGEAPDLRIPEKGDMQYKTDFRQVYATVLHKWLDTDPTKVLGKKFEEVAIL